MPAPHAPSSMEPSEAGKSRAADQALPDSAPGDLSEYSLLNKPNYLLSNLIPREEDVTLQADAFSFEQLTLQLEAAGSSAQTLPSNNCHDCGSSQGAAGGEGPLCLTCGGGSLIEGYAPAVTAPHQTDGHTSRWVRLSPDAIAFIKRKLSEARKNAASQGKSLLLDQLECDRCGSAAVALALPYGHWQCKTCGSQISGLQVRAAEAEILPIQTAPAALPPPIETGAGKVKIFDQNQLVAAAGMIAVQHTDSESRSRATKMLDHLIETGGERTLAPPPEDWRILLEGLASNFPNFKAVIQEVIRPSLAISASGGISRPPPILLLGAPGVGKSYFCSVYASMVCVPFVSLDMSAATTGASLCGLSVHWSNAGPGEILKTLAFGRDGKAPTANPLFFLDEVDKVALDQRFDPLSGLYGLLEIESARRFEDQSFPGVSLDASHIQWVLAANSLEGIPKPLLNRMHVIEIQPPSDAEKVKMFINIYAGLVRATGLRVLDEDLDCGIAGSLLELNPRQFKILAGIAMGRAIEANRRNVLAEDFATQKPPRRKTIGF